MPKQYTCCSQHELFQAVQLTTSTEHTGRHVECLNEINHISYHII